MGSEGVLEDFFPDSRPLRLIHDGIDYTRSEFTVLSDSIEVGLQRAIGPIYRGEDGLIRTENQRFSG